MAHNVLEIMSRPYCISTPVVHSRAPTLPFARCTLNSLELGAVRYAKRYYEGPKSLTTPKLHRQSYASLRASVVFSKASDEEAVAEARKTQLETTEVLAEMLKSDNPEHIAELHLESLTEEFFLVASTYLGLAKKEGNAEVVSQLELMLKVAQKVKERTLRPEIRLLNQLLRDKGTTERQKTIENNEQLLSANSYFFPLLDRMIQDVENQHGNPQRLKLLTQLRMISSDTKDFSKSLKKGR